MLFSPSKRRKIFETTSLSAGAFPPSPSRHVNKSPTTPSRASYQAPTRSSLARSHPDVLSQTQRRPQTVSRGNLLRKELLAARNNDFSAESVAHESNQTFEDDALLAHQVKLADVPDTSNAIHQASVPSVPVASEAEPVPSQIRSPLRPRQPPSAITPETTRARLQSEECVSPIMEPKLFNRREPRPPSRPGSNEPELPPTPVQLGLAPPAERPRGLFSSSSSPRRSSGGSGRRHHRLQGSTMLTSSPLKPKAAPPQTSIAIQPEEQEHPHPAEEAPESDVEFEQDDPAAAEAAPNDAAQPNADSNIQLDRNNAKPVHTDPAQTPANTEQQFGQNHEVVNEPEDIMEQRRQLSNLRADLKRAQEQVGELESITHDASSVATSARGRILKLLQTDIVEHKVESGQKEVVDFGPHLEKYLSLFEADNLHLSTTSNAININQRQKVVHDIILSTKAPLPPNTFSVRLQTTADAENVQVEAISHIIKPTTNFGASQKELKSWISTRLENSLHKTDVAGLVWGACRLFEECIRRAKAMALLDQRYNGAQIVVSNLDWKSTTIDPRDTEHIIRHLNHSQMQFGPKEDTESKVRIMLVWRNELDWAGRVISTKEVLLSGIPLKAQIAAKELFDRLIGDEDVVKAFGAVWGLVTSAVEA